MPSSSENDANSDSTLRLIGFIGFTSMASMRLCDGMLVALGHEFGVSIGDAAMVISAFTIAYGALQFFYGPLGDRLGKLRVVVMAATGCAVASVLTALAPSLSLLVLARAAMGAAAAGIIPLSLAWVGDNSPYDQRQAMLARLMGSTIAGMMLGSWFGGVAPDLIGWRPAFALLALMFSVTALALHRHALRLPAPAALPAATSAPTASTASFLRDAVDTLRLLSQARVRWVLAVTGIEGALAFGTMALAPSHLATQHGIAMASAANVVLLYGLGGLAYSQGARRWLLLLGERGLSLTGGMLMAVGLLTLAWADHLVLAAGGCFLSGLGFYMLHNTLQTQATQMAPHARGRAVTLFASVLFFGQSIGISGIAHAVDVGRGSLAFSAAAVCLLALALNVRRGVGTGRVAGP